MREEIDNQWEKMYSTVYGMGGGKKEGKRRKTGEKIMEGITIPNPHNTSPSSSVNESLESFSNTFV